MKQKLGWICQSHHITRHQNSCHHQRRPCTAHHTLQLTLQHGCFYSSRPCLKTKRFNTYPRQVFISIWKRPRYGPRYCTLRREVRYFLTPKNNHNLLLKYYCFKLQSQWIYNHISYNTVDKVFTEHIQRTRSTQDHRLPLYFCRFGFFHKAEVYLGLIPISATLPVYVHYLGCTAMVYSPYVVHFGFPN